MNKQWTIDKNHCENSAALKMPGKGNLSLECKDLFGEHVASFNYLEGVKVLADKKATAARESGDVEDVQDAVEVLSMTNKVHGGIQAQLAMETAKKSPKPAPAPARRSTGQAMATPLKKARLAEAPASEPQT